MSAKNLLKNLTATAPKKDSKPTQDRPSVEIPDVARLAFVRLVSANAILEVAEARKEAEETIVKDTMLEAFAASLFRNGTMPPNPKLTADRKGKPDMAGIFQVQQRYKINMPDDVDGNSDIPVRLKYALVEAGLDVEDADDLVTNEIDAEPLVTLRPFGELVNGHYEGQGKNRTFVEATATEKAVGQKLLEFVSGIGGDPLSDEERALVVQVQENVKVKEGFLARLKTQDQVVAVLKVITPVHFVSHMKYGISDTPEQRQERLKEIADDLIGYAAEEELRKAA
jgi:hypothetical protein